MPRPRQLLVVDDGPATREILSSLFEERGLSVEEAASAPAALARAAEQDFDVVLTEVGMPGLSGVELVGELRRLRPDTPVVLMGAFDSDGEPEATRVGAFDQLSKPLDFDAVVRVVERALAARAAALEDEESSDPDENGLAPESAGGRPDGDGFLRTAAARGMTLDELDALYTEQVLQHTGGNKVRAARILGIDRKTLYRRAERKARGHAARAKGA